LSWGFWSGDIRYDTAISGFKAVGERDRFNLNTYVVGTMSTLAQLNAQTGTATYTGHKVGNVQWGANSYVAAGSVTHAWSFGSMTGQWNSSFDGLTATGNTALVNGGPGFSGSLSVTAGAGTFTNTASGLNGAFFSNGGPTATGVQGVAGQAGNFTITGTRAPAGGPTTSYQAGGIFVLQRQP
jgi:trimeric autotransporter adhesin